MGALAILVLGGLAAAALWVWLVGRDAPAGGSAQLGLRSARDITEDRAALEAEDLQQLLEASNARRRRRGERGRSVHDVESIVAEDMRARMQLRESVLADQDLDELLAATNARRVARGLQPRSAEQARRELGSGPTPPIA